jgi:hypothetical protein
MKLSDRKLSDFLRESTGYSGTAIEEALLLESDSQMLEDLIEMMKEYRISGIGNIELYDRYGNEKASYRAPTQREAIAAAIKEWKK